MSRYATGTHVNVDRSRAEIERRLLRYGAEEFGYLNRRTEGIIGFLYQGIRVQMTVPMLTPEAFATTTTGRSRTQATATKEYEADTRRRWRSLCLVIKALLVGIDDGVLTFEQAFMPYMVMGDGQTIYQHALPHIQKALAGGQMPSSLKQLEALPAGKQGR